MKALILSEPNKIEIVNMVKPVPKAGQALIRIKAASLNHRDLWCLQGRYPNIVYGTVLGSDGAGIVESVGQGVSKEFIGREVIINPNINWGNDPKVQSAQYKILGMPENGTFAEYMAVDIDRLYDKPKHLNYHDAAALPLSGLTAYRAVFTQGKIDSGKTVLITGVGGGVAQFAFLFSLAAGAKVYVTSSKDDQLDKAKALGAAGAFNYKSDQWEKSAAQVKFDVIIDSAGGDSLNTLIKLMNPGGKIVFYGATTGVPSSLNLHRLFWNQISLQGTTMGNDKEFEAMIKFVEDHKITPIIDSARPFHNIKEAFAIMESAKQSGKLVVTF